MQKELKDVKISVRVRSSEKEFIEEIAIEKDVSVAQIMREAIRELLRKEGFYDRQRNQ